MNYVSRAEWGARPAKSKVLLSPGQIQGIFVHHTVTPTAPEIQQVRNVQAFHMDSKGWNDIAYSWLVGQSGAIYEGRGWLVNGGHTEGWNFTSHAVCFIGNSDTDVPSEAALRSIAEVIAESERRFGGFVKRHGAVNQTGCPGSHLSQWVDNGRPLSSVPVIPVEEDDMALFTEADKKALMDAVADTQSRVADVQSWVKGNIAQGVAKLVATDGDTDLAPLVEELRKLPAATVAALKEAL